MLFPTMRTLSIFISRDAVASVATVAKRGFGLAGSTCSSLTTHLLEFSNEALEQLALRLRRACDALLGMTTKQAGERSRTARDGWPQ